MATTKKDNKGYKRTVKAYECYRSFLRNIMIYGYRSRDEYLELGIRGRSYDNYKRVLLDCIDNGFISERYEGKEKILSFNADLYCGSRNFLIDTYFNKGIKKSTTYCILFLIIIANAEGGIAINELTDIIAFIQNNTDYNLEYSSVRRWLDQLELYGYIKSESKGNKKLYSLPANFLDELTENEIQSLYTAVNFYANVSLLSVPGYYLANTIENYMHTMSNKQTKKCKLWQYRCQNYSRIVDDEIIYTILQAIENKCALSFKYGENKKVSNVLPQKIVTDYPYGRTYLLGMDKMTYKIDKISKIKTQRSSPSKTKIQKADASQQLALLFTFNDYDDNKVVTETRLRLKNEAYWMQKEKKAPNQYLYTAWVSDALSYAPWVRTFGKFVTPAPQCDISLKNKLYDDKKEALQGYGII